MKKNTHTSKIVTGTIMLGMACMAGSVFAQGMRLPDMSALTLEQKQQLEAAIATHDPVKIKETMENLGIAIPVPEMMKERMEQKESKGEDRIPMLYAHDEKEKMGIPTLTEEQKTKLKEARESGDQEKMHEAMQELGIAVPNKEEMEKRMEERKNKMEEVKAAVDAGDYEAYQAAIEGTPMADKVDQVTFEALAKAQDLRESGDKKGAFDLIKGLGMDFMHREFSNKFVRQNLDAADKELVKKAKDLVKSGDALGAQEIFATLKEKYEVELAQPIKKFSLFGWLKKKSN